METEFLWVKFSLRSACTQKQIFYPTEMTRYTIQHTCYT